MGEDWRERANGGWRVSLPSSVGGGVVKSLRNPEITTMALFRGWIGEDAVFVGVSSRPREHASLRGEARKVSRHFHGGPVDGEFVAVPGGRGGARRVDGLMDIEEGYGDPPNWTERVTCVVVASGKHEVVVLTIRRHPDAPLDDAVDRIVASFQLTTAA